jgi:LmbE family N-acetylglucosaminyl deacetylase
VNVLAFGAHPDDIELYCGGTLAKYAEAGHAVTMVVICNGIAGRGEMSADEIVEVRAEESRNAASVIGADIIHLGYPDRHMPLDEPIRRRITEIIRRARPAIIMAHTAGDCYLDHQRASRLVEECLNLAPDEQIETESPPLLTWPLLYHMDTVTGLGFEPQEYVDITGVFEKKREMVACHASQMGLWQSDPCVDSPLEMMEICGRFRGIQCGVRYAEAFRTGEKWGQAWTTRPLP